MIILISTRAFAKKPALYLLICSRERRFLGKQPKTHWYVPTYRWCQKSPSDINSINSSHVETVCL